MQVDASMKLDVSFDEKIEAAGKSLGRVALLRQKKVALEAVVSECTDGLHSIDYAVESVSETKRIRDVADQAARLNDLISKYSTILAEWVDAVDCACDCIVKMRNGTHAKILAMKYIRGMRWSEICDETGYSYSRMMKMREDALAEYYDVMPAEDKVYLKDCSKKQFDM